MTIILSTSVSVKQNVLSVLLNKTKFTFECSF